MKNAQPGTASWILDVDACRCADVMRWKMMPEGEGGRRRERERLLSYAPVNHLRGFLSNSAEGPSGARAVTGRSTQSPSNLWPQGPLAVAVSQLGVQVECSEFGWSLISLTLSLGIVSAGQIEGKDRA